MGQKDISGQDLEQMTSDSEMEIVRLASGAEVELPPGYPKYADLVGYPKRYADLITVIRDKGVKNLAFGNAAATIGCAIGTLLSTVILNKLGFESPTEQLLLMYPLAYALIGTTLIDTLAVVTRRVKFEEMLVHNPGIFTGLALGGFLEYLI